MKGERRLKENEQRRLVVKVRDILKRLIIIKKFLILLLEAARLTCERRLVQVRR